MDSTYDSERDQAIDNEYAKIKKSIEQLMLLQEGDINSIHQSVKYLLAEHYDEKEQVW